MKGIKRFLYFPSFEKLKEKVQHGWNKSFVRSKKVKKVNICSNCRCYSLDGFKYNL